MSTSAIRPAEPIHAAETGTVVMPIVSAEAAAKAEDKEFWGKITELEDDV